MNESPFWVGESDGFPPAIGRLVRMLRYAQDTTLQAVHGLTVEQLDHLHDAQANSIGMLLAHITAVEAAYQIDTFENRDFTPDEVARWAPALDLGDRGRSVLRGRALGHYLDEMADVRISTLRNLAERSDDWLDVATPFWNGQLANNHFKWFHVMEDEVNHRGQIRWLRRRLPARLAPTPG